MRQTNPGQGDAQLRLRPAVTLQAPVPAHHSLQPPPLPPHGLPGAPPRLPLVLHHWAVARLEGVVLHPLHLLPVVGDGVHLVFDDLLLVSKLCLEAGDEVQLAGEL